MMVDDKKKDEAKLNDNGASEESTVIPPKKSSKKLILFMTIPLVLIAIAGAVLWFTPFGKHLLGLDKGEKKTEVKLPEHLTYYELPELTVNIQSDSQRKPFLKLSVKLELNNPEDVATLDLVKPRIIDAFQIYLHELRVDDLEGSAGTQRLKEELLKRANIAAAPVKVSNVLFGTFAVM